MRRSDPIILADADNTLWDTNSVFANGQLKLLELVEQFSGLACPELDRLGFVRAYDQAIASRHHLHLKYPKQMLVATLAAGLRSELPDIAAEAALYGRPATHCLSERQITDAVAAYSEALTRVPELLPNVRAGLELARAHDLTVFVMTEGRVDLQRRALLAHDLERYVERVWELTKSVAQFGRLRRRFDPKGIVVIGDQPDRDIVPAHDAGCRTVLVPSRFRPRWQSESERKMADYVAADFLEAMEWVVRYPNSMDASVSESSRTAP